MHIYTLSLLCWRTVLSSIFHFGQISKVYSIKTYGVPSEGTLKSRQPPIEPEIWFKQPLIDVFQTFPYHPQKQIIIWWILLPGFLRGFQTVKSECFSQFHRKHSQKTIKTYFNVTDLSMIIYIWIGIQKILKPVFLNINKHACTLLKGFK